jgi:hypothetical protein
MLIGDKMLEAWRRIGRDLRNRRFVDAYALALIAFVLAVLSVVGDIVPDQVRWAAVLAGVGILVLRSAVPESPSRNIDNVLKDRFAFDGKPIVDRLKDAKEVWIYAPSAVNLLTSQNCEILRRGALNKGDGVVRVVVLDPTQQPAIELATRQLDDSLDYPVQDFRESLGASTRLLSAMNSWSVSGSFEYRFLSYNPGFSLVAIDANGRNGHLIVEVHGFHNESTSSRMHIEIDRKDSEHWYEYWIDQFTRVWEAASSRQNDI